MIDSPRDYLIDSPFFLANDDISSSLLYILSISVLLFKTIAWQAAYDHLPRREYLQNA